MRRPGWPAVQADPDQAEPAGQPDQGQREISLTRVNRRCAVNSSTVQGTVRAARRIVHVAPAGCREQLRIEQQAQRQVGRDPNQIAIRPCSSRRG